MAVRVAGSDSWAATWTEDDGALAHGKLVFAEDELMLEGRTDHGDRVTHTIPYAELDEVHLGDTRKERLKGQPTIVLERDSLPPLRLAVLGFGVTRQIAYHLSTSASDHHLDRS